MGSSVEDLAPRLPGETNNEYKRRRLLALLDWVHRFHKEHGHTDIPWGAARFGRSDAREFWAVLRGTYAGPTRDTLPQFARDQLERMAAAGVGITPEAAGAMRQPREPVIPPEHQEDLPYLQAITAFIKRHGNDKISPHAVTRTGYLPYGMKANAWRLARAQGTLSPWLTERLNAIPGWSWELSDGPRRRRTGVVVVPEDTTQMRATGLRQFTPDA